MCCMKKKKNEKKLLCVWLSKIHSSSFMGLPHRRRRRRRMKKKLVQLVVYDPKLKGLVVFSNIYFIQPQGPRTSTEFSKCCDHSQKLIPKFSLQMKFSLFINIHIVDPRVVICSGKTLSLSNFDIISEKYFPIIFYICNSLIIFTGQKKVNPLLIFFVVLLSVHEQNILFEISTFRIRKELRLIFWLELGTFYFLLLVLIF